MVKTDGVETAPAGRGARTRAAILAAARTRFATAGFDATTVASIAADAGVSEPTVAFHFGSKAGLLVSVMGDYYDDLLDRIEAVVDPTVPPADRLADFARFWLAHNAEHYALIEQFGRHGRRSETDEVVAALAGNNRRVTTVLDGLVEEAKHAGVIRADIATRMVRDGFFGTAEHLLIGRALTGRPADLRAAAGELLDLLLLGAGHTPAPSVTGPTLASLDAKLGVLLARTSPPA